MGHFVTRIDNVPCNYSYYFFLLGNRERQTGIGPRLYERFDEIASSLYGYAAIIKTYNSRAFYSELVPHLYNDQNNDVLNLFRDHNEPSLLVLDQHPLRYKSGKGLFLLVSFDMLDKLYDSSNDLVNDIVTMGLSGEDNISPRITAYNSEDKPNFWTRVYNSILLQPNFTGFGFDIKVLFEKSKKKKIDKVEYVYFDNRKQKR